VVVLDPRVIAAAAAAAAADDDDDDDCGADGVHRHQ